MVLAMARLCVQRSRLTFASGAKAMLAQRKSGRVILFVVLGCRFRISWDLLDGWGPFPEAVDAVSFRQNHLRWYW